MMKCWKFSRALKVFQSFIKIIQKIGLELFKIETENEVDELSAKLS
jgi:hypothetical protein